MWIFRKQGSASQSNNGFQFYLLCGRTYIIGRKNADIIIDGDPSISRKHAILSVKKSSSNDSTQPPDCVWLTNTSKTGVKVNGQPTTTNVELELQNGDFVDIGNPSQRYELVHHKLVVVTSCVNSSAAKATVKTTVEALGGRFESNWTGNSTHLIMEKVTFTIKVVGAIACAKPIVTVKYLEDLLDTCDKKKGLGLPDATKYLPPVVEKSLTGQDLMFLPNANRCSLLKGKLFVVLAAQQFERIKDVVVFAGGEMALKQTKDAKLISGAISSQTLVLQVEKRDEKGMNPSQNSWMREIYAKLKKQKLRPIRESEIGLGIFNVCLEKHCNPTLSGAPVLIGNTHTQVMQESMCLNTQQLSTQPPPSSGTAPPDVLDVATPQLPSTIASLSESTRPTLPVSMKETNIHEERESVNENGKRRMISSENHPDAGKQSDDDLFTTKKVKVSPVDNNLMKTEDSYDGFDEKPANKCRVRGTQPHKNIIDIEDDEDEDDVFSVNFPKPPLPTSTMTMAEETTMKTADLFDIDDDDDDNDDDASARQAVPGTAGLSYPAVTADIAPSAVLFTPHSKKVIPETCFTAVTPAVGNEALDENRIPETCYSEIVTSRPPAVDDAEKSRVSESCPLKAQEYTCDDDDSDDDPFAFSVSKWKTSTATNTQVKDKKESGRSERDSFLFKTREESVSEEGKLASDSDTSANRTSTDDEKQHSRFRKGVSSSQCSDASQEVLVSDGEGNLVPKDKPKKVTCVKESVSEATKETVYQLDGVNEQPKDVDMSYLLDGCDDDMDDVEPSKEYHPQPSSQNYSAPNGFISTRTPVRLESRKIKKEEDDPDLIGIDTRNLVTRTVAKLVMKPQSQHKRPDPRLTGLRLGANGSRLKNFKNFRKQHYAGSSSISGVRLHVFESDNEERAALFADICEKDEEEAAENRRIDKMFDVIPSSRKR